LAVGPPGLASIAIFAVPFLPQFAAGKLAARMSRCLSVFCANQNPSDAGRVYRMTAANYSIVFTLPLKKNVGDRQP